MWEIQSKLLTYKESRKVTHPKRKPVNGDQFLDNPDVGIGRQNF